MIQFIKKKLYQEKKKKLHSKGYELGFLNGLIEGRKKLKLGLVRNSTLDPSSQVFTTAKKIQSNILVDENSNIKVYTGIPKLFRIPFWLVPVNEDQKVNQLLTLFSLF